MSYVVSYEKKKKSEFCEKCKDVFLAKKWFAIGKETS